MELMGMLTARGERGKKAGNKRDCSSLVQTFPCGVMLGSVAAALTAL